MPHRCRSLLRGPAAFAPVALIVILACAPDASSVVADTATPSGPVGHPDPAAALDSEFQRVRSALNEEARALAEMDRASAEYTTRYDAWLRDAAAAESLRARRDSIRRAPASPAT